MVSICYRRWRALLPILILLSRRNEYTGASFKDAPQPKRLKPSKLCPSQDGHTLSMRQVEGLYDAFANHSLRFQVELVGVSPMLADMKLIDPSRKVEIFVEMKEKFCNLITTGHSQVLGFMQVRDGTRLTFSWKSQWDYIYSTVANMPSTAILLPRDEIPLTWFNFWPKKSGFVLELEADFQQYSVDTHSDETMVQDIEKILIRMEKKSGSMRAKRPIPVEVSEEEYSQRTTVHRQGGEHWEERWSTSSFLRGLGSAEHGELRDLTYGQFASEVLIEICRARLVIL